jgi:hypothetical protein
MLFDNRREFLRVLYSYAGHPVLTLAGVQSRVRDCSERGLSVVLARGVTLARGDAVEGLLWFPHGDELSVSGRVVRVVDGVAGILLDPPGIPVALILDEQRRQRRR